MFRGDETTITLSRGGGLDSSSMMGNAALLGLEKSGLGWVLEVDSSRNPSRQVCGKMLAKKPSVLHPLLAGINEHLCY